MVKTDTIIGTATVAVETKVISIDTVKRISADIKTEKHNIRKDLANAEVAVDAVTEEDASKRINTKNGGIFYKGENGNCLALVPRSEWVGYALANADKLDAKIKRYNELTSIDNATGKVIAYALDMTAPLS